MPQSSKAHSPTQPIKVISAPRFIGDSAAAAGIRRLVEQVAPSESSVLILGESGTGKEIVARQIHERSARRKGPFVPVNCGAIPADLLESELFGHEKGAFTGALSTRQGRFELAAGGTLFLDEIGDMPLSMQVKLLRVLQERCFERVGSGVMRDCDVRIVAATHQDLELRVEQGAFRVDLFYRLNVFPVEIPPLRERREDIPGLLRHFAGQLPAQGLAEVAFDSAAQSALQHYDWPGNVRELANLVERLAILHADGGVGLAQLPPRVAASLPEGAALAAAPAPTVPPAASLAGVTDLKAYLAEVEHRLLLEALTESQWVVARAAARLNLRRTTLVEKMRKFGLERGAQVSES